MSQQKKKQIISSRLAAIIWLGTSEERQQIRIEEFCFPFEYEFDVIFS